MKKNQVDMMIVQPSYDVNDPVLVAVREEVLRRLIERGEDCRIDWLKYQEKGGQDGKD